MLRLRPYKSCDAEHIARWVDDERVFHIWGGDLFGAFPINGDTINNTYFNKNGNCAEPDNFYPMTAFDESGVVGHFIIRYIGGNNKVVRFGWVVVDGSRRGRGLGREMLTLALKFAFEIHGAERVTIGVFENNPRAYKCYTSIGFSEDTAAPEMYAEVEGEKVRVIELAVTKEEYEAKERV